MQIAIDIRCLMNKNYSGVSQYTYYLLKNLFELDKKNKYKLFYNSSKNVTANLPQFNHDNIQRFGFKFSNKILNFCLKFLKYPMLDKLMGGADIFFIPNINFFSASTKCKKILTIHDLSFELYPHFFSLKRRLWHKFINARKIVDNCDKIIADSENSKNDLIKLYGVESKKIKVIHLGVDQDIFKIIQANDEKLKEIKKKYGLPENFLLVLSTIEPRKNIEGIIEAFNIIKEGNSELKDMQLVIVGEIGWKSKRVFTFADNAQFKDQIKFIGYVDNKDKVYLYNLAKILLFPSFYEGFGLPILEAQACGLPVIAGLNSSLAEITNGSAFLAKPDNLTEITTGIKKILKDTQYRQNLIKKGRQNIQRFSWQKCAQETLDYILK
ncbi:glycosyltransferase family 4 protein [Candidatus Falkowbacteria bacterium]|nr:glycosyltransferase family 4 protein [Candidatus Falkowbacteria bacterium]